MLGGEGYLYRKWLGGIVLLALLPFVLPTFYLTLVIRILFFSIFALSLSFMAGQLGLTSLGQTTFFGVAAYALAILTRQGLAFPIPVILAICGAIIVAAALGLLVVRTSGIYFLMITLAFGQIAWGLAFQWISVTGGYDGISGIRAPNIAGIAFSNSRNFYYVLVVVFVIVMVFLSRLINSKFGLVLRGIRESPSRMEALGYPVPLLKYLAFVIAGGLAGISGVFFAYYTGLVNPSGIDLSRAVWILVVSILGGVHSLYGPVVGTGVVVFLEILVSQITSRYMVVIGTLFVVIILFAPDGILGRVAYFSRKYGLIPIKSRQITRKEGD